MARPGISTKNTKKIPLGQKFWNPKKIPQKYRKNTKNTHFWYFGGIFSVFSGYFGGEFWESRISGRGVFFRYFWWKFRVGPFRGSVAGRSVLKYRIVLPEEVPLQRQICGNGSRESLILSRIPINFITDTDFRLFFFLGSHHGSRHCNGIKNSRIA